MLLLCHVKFVFLRAKHKLLTQINEFTAKAEASRLRTSTRHRSVTNAIFYLTRVKGFLNKSE